MQHPRLTFFFLLLAISSAWFAIEKLILRQDPGWYLFNAVMFHVNAFLCIYWAGKKDKKRHRKIKKGTRCVRCGLAKEYWSKWECKGDEN